MTRLLTARCLYYALVFSSILLSCDSKPNPEAKERAKEQGETRVLSSNNLHSQRFTINAQRDTIIKGISGTILRIYKNSFVTNDGKPANGNIDIELQEAFTPTDVLLSGLTTTSDGQFLETGGMLYVNASSGEQHLEIAKDKLIGVIAPDTKLKKGMKLFEGQLDSNVINWRNPNPILNDKLIAASPIHATPATSDTIALIENIESDSSKSEVLNANIKKNKDARQEAKQSEEEIFINEIQNEKGVNFFLADYNTNYVFVLKKLGWANIDRLYADPRTKEVEFITAIENQKEFETVYVTLIITNKAMYIPGYQRKDETFSFTHNDEEIAQLPVGETATILATGYKDNKPYYAIKTLKISERQRINIKLEETTEEKLKDALNKEI